MSDAKPSLLVAMLDTLAMEVPISPEDSAAFLRLPYTSRVVDAGSYLIREGEVSEHCVMLVSGLACRHKISGEGFRQIVSINLPGELVDLQQLYLKVADHNVQALTKCKVVVIPQESLRQLATDRIGIAQAIVATVLVELAAAREWILNIGRRDARTRIAHFMCELAVRLSRLDELSRQSFELPMTQEQLGDALGLTAVHINRMLKSLVRDGLIEYSKRGIIIPNWEELVKEGDFTDRYLHCDRESVR